MGCFPLSARLVAYSEDFTFRRWVKPVETGVAAAAPYRVACYARGRGGTPRFYYARIGSNSNEVVQPFALEDLVAVEASRTTRFVRFLFYLFNVSQPRFLWQHPRSNPFRTSRL